MKPPRIKAAVIWGKEALRVRSLSPITIAGAQRTQRTLPAGETSLKLIQSNAAARESWLWIGNSSEQEMGSVLSRLLASQNLISCLWSVGLTPTREGDWRPRGYRLLVQSKKQDQDLEALSGWLHEAISGAQAVKVEMPAGQPSGRILIRSADQQDLELALPVNLKTAGKFEALDAPIGEGFHWSHEETLELPAALWVAAGTDGKLCAGVELEVEDYLTSVNSSEMPADSPLEFLKSQVVAARSWLLANWGSHHPGEPYIVCAGDHCQCYYGPGRIEQRSRHAASGTEGEVLLYGERICDARYAKSCGGVTEPGANVWPHMDEPYLRHLLDLPDGEILNLSQEADFRRFQARSDPGDACCSPGYAPLEGHLAELANLYRWQQEVDLRELRQVLKAKTGRDPGDIEALIPGRRGPSGRLIDLAVRGKQGNLLLSPELEIRRALSPTHLPSSAFWVEPVSDRKVILHGMGWGHGVGLCQLGAAALAAKGYDYGSILQHYYPQTKLRKIY